MLKRIKNFMSEEEERTDKVQYFFEKFLPQETWRFFVERARYDNQDATRQIFFESLQKIEIDPEDGIGKRVLTEAEINHLLNKITIKELYKIANQYSFDNAMILWFVLENLNRHDRDNEIKINDYIQKQKAWLGLEENEPGYFQGMTNGFCFILDRLKTNPTYIDLEFIKMLHKKCFENVHTSIPITPGKFRTQRISRNLYEKIDTIEGIIETLAYMKTENCKGMSINVNHQCVVSSTNKVFNAEKIANDIWLSIKEGKFVEMILFEKKEDLDVEQYLNEISQYHLDQFKRDIDLAKTKIEKLTAIFTFLKYSVLHHPFQDGVIRVYVMLLLQNLLMSVNLLPALLVDPNIIPGWSIQQMVDHYLLVEKEMEKILQNPSYLSSKNFEENNIDTNRFLESLSQKEHDYFNTNIKKINTAFLKYQQSPPINDNAFPICKEKNT